MNPKAIGESWDDFKKAHYTPEELAASCLRVELMRELAAARKEKGFSPMKTGGDTKRLTGPLSFLSMPIALNFPVFFPGFPGFFGKYLKDGTFFIIIYYAFVWAYAANQLRRRQTVWARL